MVLTRKHILGLTIVAVAGSLLYFLYDPSLSNFFPKCPFHSLTNLDCPGCGSQRSIHALLNGNIILAADFNLLVVVFLPVLMYSGAATVANVFFKQHWGQQLFYSPLVVKIILVTVVLFWILRNLDIAAFRWLSAGY